MEWILGLCLMLVCFAGMALGLLVKNKPLKKGCSAEPDGSCWCGRTPDACDGDVSQDT